MEALKVILVIVIDVRVSETREIRMKLYLELSRQIMLKESMFKILIRKTNSSGTLQIRMSRSKMSLSVLILQGVLQKWQL